MGLADCARLALLALTSFVLAACGRVDVIDLLDVRAVAPSRLEAGGVAEVRGAGFPVGYRGIAHFEGEVGGAPIDVEAPAVAVATDRANVQVDLDLLDRLGPGAFEGRVTLRFEGLAGSLEGAVDRVRLSVAPAHAAQVATIARARDHASTLLADVGISVLEVDPRGGLAVESVAFASAAARAGVRKGDRIVAHEGRPLGAIEDVVEPTSGLLALEIARADEAAPVHVAIAIPPSRPFDGATPGEAVALSLLVLILVAPFVRTRRAVVARAPKWRIGATLAKHAAVEVAGAMMVPLYLAIGGRQADALTAAAALGAAKLALRSPGTERWSTRLSSAAACCFGVLAAVACAGLATGTLAIRAIVDAQELAPWRWLAFTSPPALLAVLAFAWAHARGASTPTIADRFIDSASAGLVCCLLFGGFAGSPPGAAIAAAALFLAKWAALRGCVLRTNEPDARVPASCSVAILAVVGAAVWATVRNRAELELAIGPWLLGTAVVALAYELVRARRASTA